MHLLSGFDISTAGGREAYMEWVKALPADEYQAEAQHVRAMTDDLLAERRVLRRKLWFARLKALFL